MPKTFSSKRTKAFRRQQGRCFYCDQPMWLSDVTQFAEQHRITLAQAQRFRCTAEHLKARQDGGTDRAENIVAACWFCNNRRHRRLVPLEPPAYRNHVQKRLMHGRWHRLDLTPVR